MNIGKLKEVELRDLWAHEEHDFSNWLVKESNIEYLNDILGLTLVDIKREEHVGSYECDVFAKDESSGVNVVIENQLEQSNHDHLGKIITYASGLNANVIVWIVKRAKEEHRSAIEWLNNNTNNDVNFFLIELHAYRIADSDAAPKFEIIEKPNDYIKNNRISSSDGMMSKSQKERLEFWSMFNDALIEKGKPFNVRKASTDHWYDIALGSSKSHMTMELVSKENIIRIGLYMKNDCETYDKMFESKNIIEAELGLKLDWVKGSEGLVNRIKYNLKGLNFDNHSNYAQLIKDTIEIASKMQKVFKKYI